MRKFAGIMLSAMLITAATGVMSAHAADDMYYENWSNYAADLGLSDDWISEIDASQNDPVTMYCTGNNVNIRKLPNTSSEIIDRAPVNCTFEVVGHDEGWYCITGEDGIAFIKDEYLSTEQVRYIDLGQFTVTYYCCESFHHICNNGTGLTATGDEVHPGCLSVDPKVIPLGSKVLIDGVEYIANDTGGRIRGRIMDMAVATHQEALDLGRRKVNVKILVE